MQRARRIWEEGLGSNPQVATALANLAALRKEQGRYSESEPLLQRALAIREEALGPQHPDVASTLNNLGMLLQKQGNYAAAEPLFQRALAIWETGLGLEHPNVDPRSTT